MHYFRLEKNPRMVSHRYCSKKFNTSEVFEILWIKEWGAHIIFEALLLTISANPIFSKYLLNENSTSFQLFHYAVDYLTLALQICSIIGNVLCLSAASEIPPDKFVQWALSRMSTIALAGKLHTMAIYSFVVLVSLWPLAKYPYPISIVCFMTFTLTMIIFFCGPFQLWIRDLFPIVHFELNSGGEEVQAIMESDVNVLFPSPATPINEPDQPSHQPPRPASPNIETFHTAETMRADPPDPTETDGRKSGWELVCNSVGGLWNDDDGASDDHGASDDDDASDDHGEIAGGDCS